MLVVVSMVRRGRSERRAFWGLGTYTLSGVLPTCDCSHHHSWSQPSLTLSTYHSLKSILPYLFESIGISTCLQASSDLSGPNAPTSEIAGPARINESSKLSTQG